jgi:hypothetical protein
MKSHCFLLIAAATAFLASCREATVRGPEDDTIPETVRGPGDVPAPEPVSEPQAAPARAFKSSWTGDRRWAGPSYWANRIHDWRISDGILECTSGRRRLRMRTLHLLTHRLAEGDGTFEMEARVTGIGPEEGLPPDSAAGFLVGAGGAAMDYRAAAIVHESTGPGGGLFAGVNGRGEPFIIDNTKLWDGVPMSDAAAAAPVPGAMHLRLQAAPNADGTYTLRLEARAADGDGAGGTSREATLTVAADRVVGSVALVSQPGTRRFESYVRRGRTRYRELNIPGGRYTFDGWTLSGSKVDVDMSRALGPILATQYTLSKGVLKMTAQMMPVEEKDGTEVLLQTRKGGAWQTVARTRIIVPGHTAPLRVAGWDATQDTPYRVVYDMQLEGKARSFTWEGVIRKDPVDKDTIVVAGFTGNHNNSHRFGSPMNSDKSRRTPFDWVSGMWFPHAGMIAHVEKHKPDVLFFSGDQVYENSSPTFADYGNRQIDYLYKWYMWCWAYRDLMRDIPSVALPDDHDVYQGNLWGEGGRATTQDDRGGYLHGAEFVNMVERTQTSHLPDPFDPRPVEQGIGVYFTDMTYGRIGFAILEDRKFKSGCNGRVPDHKYWRADHIVDPKFDVKKADAPGLVLLGERQLAFLDEFATDWSGQDMKMALSQTIFAGMATHHGGRLQRLICDLDSNGWPQSGRNRALRALRRGFVCHLAGDQHLASLVQHGVDEHNDAVWSFCVPSVANFYPRGWKPEVEGKNRTPGMPPHLGEHQDGFGNLVTVHAVTNPTRMTERSTGVEPLDLHDAMPGYGIVKMNKRTREITFECWPRYADPTDPATGSQYEGWPKTVSQLSNYDRKAVAHLPTLSCTGMNNPVVKVTDENTGEVVYAVRILGTSFRPKVFKHGMYTITVGEPGTDREKVLRGVKSLGAEESKTLSIAF